MKEAGELLTVNSLEKGIHFTLGHVLNAPGHVTVIVCGAAKHSNDGVSPESGGLREEFSDKVGLA